MQVLFLEFYLPCFMEEDSASGRSIFIDNVGSERVDQPKPSLGFKQMTVPILAGILSALRRVIARRVSLKVWEWRRYAGERSTRVEEDEGRRGERCFAQTLV
ncbi:hypothetical protein KSP40_PGU013703 [Platanthera guangdongensis]|uniref:Uncharacterized protein n=1 Tax=Platanthera guangdongensis TaxID=2320717 RepID=A0ABR2N3J3_9ASPA